MKWLGAGLSRQGLVPTTPRHLMRGMPVLLKVLPRNARIVSFEAIETNEVDTKGRSKEWNRGEQVS